MVKMFDLAIVIPIYNPHNGWANEIKVSLESIFAKIQNLDIVIVFVDDGSKVNLGIEFELLQKVSHPIKYLKYEENKGKGYAIRHGMASVKATNYIYTDWDFPFGVNSLVEIHDAILKNEADLVISNRSQKYYDALPFMRRVLSFCTKNVTFFFLGMQRLDTQAGLKAMNYSTKELFLAIKTNSFMFELEFIRMCIKNKLKIKSIEVTPKEGLQFTNFGMKTIINELKASFKILFK
jgi:glycosyltransferase involved in cell wall biosynthesis